MVTYYGIAPKMYYKVGKSCIFTGKNQPAKLPDFYNKSKLDKLYTIMIITFPWIIILLIIS